MQVKPQPWAAGVLRCLGWRLERGELPGPHGVIVVYPHTSQWDIPIGFLAALALGLRPYFWAKASLFTGLARYTIGPVLRAWGGLPIERQSPHGQVAQAVQLLKSAKPGWLALSPEGTRRYTDHWKSGFYHAALGANVPVGLAYLDFATKRLGLHEFITLSGDSDADLAQMARYYQGMQGCRAHQAAPVRLRPGGPPSQ